MHYTLHYLNLVFYDDQLSGAIFYISEKTVMVHSGTFPLRGQSAVGSPERDCGGCGRLMWTASKHGVYRGTIFFISPHKTARTFDVLRAVLTQLGCVRYTEDGGSKR